MIADTKFLTLLQVVVPPDTPLTVPSMIKVMEVLGVVSSPELVNNMQLVTALIPTGTPATLGSLIKLLSNLIKHHPKATQSHHEALSKLLKSLEGLPDSALTFGTFLPICEVLIKAPPIRFGKSA